MSEVTLTPLSLSRADSFVDASRPGFKDSVYFMWCFKFLTPLEILPLLQVCVSWRDAGESSHLWSAVTKNTMTKSELVERYRSLFRLCSIGCETGLLPEEFRVTAVLGKAHNQRGCAMPPGWDDFARMRERSGSEILPLGDFELDLCPTEKKSYRVKSQISVNLPRLRKCEVRILNEYVSENGGSSIGVEQRPGKPPRFVVFGTFLMFGDDVNVDDAVAFAYHFSDGKSEDCMFGEKVMEENTPVRRIAIYDSMGEMLEAFRDEMKLRADKVKDRFKKAPSYNGWVFTEFGYE